MSKYYRKITRTFNATYVHYVADGEEQEEYLAGSLTKQEVIRAVYPFHPNVIQHVKIRCEMENQTFINLSKIDIVEENEYLN